MNSKDRDVQLVMDAATRLGEEFDAVQVFASRHESAEADGTIAVCWGVGNEFARYGQVRQWVKREETIQTGKDEEDEET